MRQLGPVVLVLIVLSISAGCTLLLDTSSSPYKCETDDDCVRLPNAACDDVKKQCVPRLPFADGGVPSDTGAGGTGGLSCELFFDNRVRIDVSGPDGGLRPLPEGP